MLVDAVILHPDLDLKTKHAVCRAANKVYTETYFEDVV